MTCPSLETLAAWLLSELEESDANALEDHVFDCDRCAAQLVRLEALVDRIRTVLPPVLTPERRARLEGAGDALPGVTVRSGDAATIEFRKGRDFGFWLMKSDLDGVDRVDCELLDLAGTPFISFPDVPFDRARGEVVLGCQVHYRHLPFPTELVARLTSSGAAGVHRVSEYRLSHKFLDE